MPNARQSGILIPEIGFNSASKGDTVGEQVYWAINRSTDLTVGTIYYSARGWEQTRQLPLPRPGAGHGQVALQRPAGPRLLPRGGRLCQPERHRCGLFRAARSCSSETTPQARSCTQRARQVQTSAVADVEYLSSFPYREAFSTNFNQAVSSDVVSTVYATREWDGMAVSAEGDRYQGEKRVANTTGAATAEEQVHIFHAPALEFTTTDHALGPTGLEWNLDSSVATLKRSSRTLSPAA